MKTGYLLLLGNIFFLFLSTSSAYGKDSKFIQYEVGDKFLIKDNLYENSKNDLFFLILKPFITENGIRYKQIFRSHVNSEFEGKETSIKLNEIIDIKSWRRLSEFYYRDNNQLFCTSPYLLNSTILLLSNSDPNRFRLLFPDAMKKKLSNIINLRDSKPKLNSWYSTDGLDFFYSCQKIEEVDKKSFKIIINNPTHGGYSLDKNSFYRNYTKISYEEMQEDIQLFLDSKDKFENVIGQQLKKYLDDFYKN